MIVIIYCLFSIALWMCVILRNSRKTHNYLHTINIYLLFYLVNVPVKMIATKCGIYLLDSNALGPLYQIGAVALTDVANLIMLMGFRSRIRIKIGMVGDKYRYNFVYANIFFSVLYYLCGMTAYGSNSVRRMFSYEMMIEYRSYSAYHRLGSGLTGICSITMEICLFVIIILGIESMRKWHMLAKIFFFMEIGVHTWYYFASTMSKTSFLLAATAFIIAYNKRKVMTSSRGIALKSILITSTLGLLAAAILELSDIADIKDASNLNMKNILTSFFNPSFDIPDNLATILHRLNNIWTGDLDLQPFLYNAFLSKIPRAIWPGKYPGDGKQMIIQALLPEFYVSPTDYNAASPGIVGDALASGGLLLLIIVCCLYGLIFYNIHIRAYKNNTLFSNIMYIYLICAINDFCRGGSGIIGNVILEFFIASIVVMIFQMLCDITYVTSKESDVFCKKGEGYA